MVKETDLKLACGRTLHIYDTGTGTDAGLSSAVAALDWLVEHAR